MTRGSRSEGRARDAATRAGGARARPLRLALALAAATGAACSRDGAERPPHLLLVSIDTLRADAVLGDGPHRASTPCLDRLAAGGRSFAEAWSHVPLTLPSHAALFTGRLPVELGLHDNAPFPLRGDVATLATLLRDGGYATAAVIGGQPLAAGCGLERGFERYDSPPRGRDGAASFGERPASEVAQLALADWARPAGGRPRFLFAHFFDPHHPYAPPPELVAGDPADDAARYRGEVASVDRELARLIAAVRATGERCLVVVTSDHGEGLGDCGERTHGFQILPSTLRVPLIVAEVEGEATRPPAGLTAVAQDRLIGLVDLLPTLLEALALPIPDGLAGVALQRGEPRTTSWVETLAPALQLGLAQATGVRADRALLLHAGTGAPQRLDSHEILAGGRGDELCLLDPGRPAPDDAELAGWRDGFDQARTRRLAPAGAAALLPSLGALGYLPGSADRELHALLPPDVNGARVSPLARLAEIDELLRAVERLERGEALAAATALTRLLERDPGNPAARFFRARARLALEAGDTARRGLAAREAANDLDALLASGAELPGTALLHAKALALAGEFDAAHAALAKLAAESPGAEVEHLLGSLRLEQRRAGRDNPFFDPQRGIDHLLRALELDPEQPGLARRLEQTLHAMARAPDAPPWVAAALERFAARRRPRRATTPHGRLRRRYRSSRRR